MKKNPSLKPSAARPSRPDEEAAAGPQNPPPAEAPAAAGRRDWLMTYVSVGFLLVGLLILAIMLPGYIFNTHTVAADKALAENDYGAAIPHLKVIVRRYSDAWGRLKQLGDCYMQKKDPDPNEALKYYQEALKNNSELNLDEEIGICYSEMGESKKAIEYFSRVMETKPESPAMNYYMGVQNFEAKHYREAARCFQATATDPKWNAKAEPYRKKLAEIVLGQNAPSPAQTPTDKH